MKPRRKKAAQAAHPWPADKVERRPLSALYPYAKNARRHSAQQIAEIVASIKEWGWTIPVLVDETGQIIAGHGRVLAAQKLGFTEVPVMIATGWTEAQKRAYVIADNKLALNSDWDREMLRLELGELKTIGFDLGTIGFSASDLGRLNGAMGLGVNLEPTFQILIECADEAQQLKLLEGLQRDGVKCRALIA